MHKPVVLPLVVLTAEISGENMVFTICHSFSQGLCIGVFPESFPVFRIYADSVPFFHDAGDTSDGLSSSNGLDSQRGLKTSNGIITVVQQSYVISHVEQVLKIICFSLIQLVLLDFYVLNRSLVEVMP